MASRVENRRSGFSLPVALTNLSRRRLSPVWRGSVSCSRSSNRTGGFPASGSRKRHTMIRVTPPATSEHNSGWLDSSSIPVSFVASGFYENIESSAEAGGRPAIDRQRLISWWVYAYSRGIGSAREIERRCEYDPAFQWLTGMEPVNY